MLVVVAFRVARSPAGALVVIAWLGFLTLANALFHIAGAVVDRGYVPGLAIAILLSLPYFGWVAGQMVRGRRVAPALLAAVAGLGAIPMAVHGYLILFRGPRLF